MRAPAVAFAVGAALGASCAGLLTARLDPALAAWGREIAAPGPGPESPGYAPLCGLVATEYNPAEGVVRLAWSPLPRPVYVPLDSLYVRKDLVPKGSAVRVVCESEARRPTTLVVGPGLSRTKADGDVEGGT